MAGRNPKSDASRRKNHKLRLFNLLYEVHIGSPVEIAVLQYLIWRANPKHYPLQAFPGIPRMAKDLDSSQSTIRRTLHRLEINGFIEIRNRHRDTQQSSNLYVINEWRLSGNKAVGDEAVEQTDLTEVPG